MINKETILSSYDDKLTLLQWLKKVEDALNDATLESVEIVDQTDTDCKLKFNFADDTSITSGTINLKGATGDDATISIGTVTTLTPGSNATVTNSGTTSDAVFNFGIPQGAKGDTGDAGGITNIDGYTGAVTTGDGIAFSNGALSSYDFNLTNTTSVNGANLTATSYLTGTLGTLYLATNTDKTIGKVYGRVGLTVSNIASAGIVWIATGFFVKVPTSAYNIITGGIGLATDFSYQVDSYMRVDTYGQVYIGLYATTLYNDKTFQLYYPASIYFFEDFGDDANSDT